MELSAGEIGRDRASSGELGRARAWQPKGLVSSQVSLGGGWLGISLLPWPRSKVVSE